MKTLTTGQKHSTVTLVVCPVYDESVFNFVCRTYFGHVDTSSWADGLDESVAAPFDITRNIPLSSRKRFAAAYEERMRNRLPI